MPRIAPSLVSEAVIEESEKERGKNSTVLNANKGSNFERGPRSREVARQLKQRREKESARGLERDEEEISQLHRAK